MAYTNLPPNLYDYFSTINQRIRKLESAPDQSMTTAVSAQSLALTSQSVATNAQLQAANASVQAVQAQSQATLASSQATYAVTTANGKNTVAYGTAAPPSGTHTTGDLYFQFNGSNQVIAQYTWNGSSWVSNPITSTVIASINAGTIVSGTITGIEFNNGSGTFHVTPAGALTASSANITGTIVAQSGVIGNTAGGSYWSITSSGITGFGSANITGGLISGSSIYIGSSGQFQVDAAGNLNASSANITGTITATSGSIAGFTIGSSQLSNTQITIYSNGNITSLGTMSAYYVAAGISLTSAGTLVVTGNSTLGSTTTTTNLTIDSTANIVGGYGLTSDWSPNSDNTYNLGISGSRRWSHVYANNTTITTSDQRLKTNITTSALGLDFINSLRPVSYQWIEGSKKLVVDAEGNPVVESVDEHGKPVYKTESIPGKRTHYGLIAQEVKSALDAANVGDFAGWVQDDITNPDSFQSVSYEQFISPLIKSVQELSNRLNKLEGK